jgi:hypothetical protein
VKYRILPFLFVLAFAAPACAQEVRDYLPAEFTRFAPRNALQMIQQVPGFSIRENYVDRGLGQASANVLVNGQRVSTKNGIYSELENYMAEAVVRIEIRDAAAYDVPGLSGMVANVVIETSRISGQFPGSRNFAIMSPSPACGAPTSPSMARWDRWNIRSAPPTTPLSAARVGQPPSMTAPCA